MICFLRTTVTATSPYPVKTTVLHTKFSFFIALLPNRIFLHDHFANPVTVPQAVILGREKVASRTERIIKSGFLLKSQAVRCANPSHDELLQPAEWGVLVAGRPKASGDPMQPLCSSLCIWDAWGECREISKKRTLVQIGTKECR